jgi:uncharacterized protein YgbK (DUF1537 family)
MRIELTFYAGLCRYLPAGARNGRASFDVPAGATVAQVLQHLGVPRDAVAIVVVDGRAEDPATHLAPGAGLCLCPPLAGAAPRAAAPPRLGIIADDLTGANDTGVQFARRGARTIVPFEWHDLPVLGRAADVLVLNTASRALTPRAAAQRVRLAAEALRRAGAEMVYKKVDSTLRGNIGAELAALLDVYPSPLAVLAPAFPPAGRAVRDGVLTVHGTPVHRTAAGTDPVTPVRESHLPSLLEAQVCRPVYPLTLSALHAAPAKLAAVLKAWRTADPAILVADAETAQDLRRIARLVLRERLPVAAGSAGLALALSEMLRWRRGRGTSLPTGGRPVLLVVGSPNPVSLGQVAQIGRAGGCVVPAVMREILSGRERFQRELSRVTGRALVGMAAGRDVVVTLEQGRRRKLLPSGSGTLCDFLGLAASRLAREGRPGGLVLCGGDIAVAACHALGARGVELVGELEPGLPWGRLVGGDLNGLPTATKAGGFGTPHAFTRALRFLGRRQRAPVGPEGG